MNFSKIVLMSLLCAGFVHGMDNQVVINPFAAIEPQDDDFATLWPFEKLGTKYDDTFALIAPAFHSSDDYLNDYLSGSWSRNCEMRRLIWQTPQIIMYYCQTL